jgi:hypothetical protein
MHTLPWLGGRYTPLIELLWNALHDFVQIALHGTCSHLFYLAPNKNGSHCI